MNILVLTRPADPFSFLMGEIAEAIRGLEWDVTVCDLNRFMENGTGDPGRQVASPQPDIIFLQGTGLHFPQDLRTPSPAEDALHAFRDLPTVRFVFKPEPPFENDHMEEGDHPFFEGTQGPNALFLSPDRHLVKRMKDLGLNKAFRFPADGMREAAPIIEQFLREHLLFRRIEGMFTGDARHDFQLLSQGAVAETVRFNGDYYVYRLASLARDMGESNLASEYIHMALEVNPAYLKARRLSLKIQP